MGDRVSAIKFFNQAMTAAQDKTQPQNANLAYQLYSSAVIADPTMAEGWFQIGNANGDMKLTPAAIAAYRRAIECGLGETTGDFNPTRMAQTMCNLGHRLYHNGEFDEAERWTEEAIEMDRNIGYAWINSSLLASLRGESDAAIALAREGFRLTNEPVAETVLAFALMHARQYAEGLRHFEARFPYKLQQFANYPYPKWQGEEGYTLFLCSEQGIGDALSFSRFIPAALKRCEFIHLMVQPELVLLFQAIFQGQQNLSINPLPHPFIPADYWSTIVSLPTALGLTDEEIINCPGLPAPPFKARTTWKSADAKLHVGVAWGGSPANDFDPIRSFDVTRLLEFYKVPGVQLYSLQVGDRAKDLHLAGCAALIRDLAPFITSVSDTTALIRELDLVITVESAVGHIAGFVGKECWIPYTYAAGDWRIGRDERGPIWYPNHRIFRQGRDQRWEPVFERITQALRAKV